MRTSNSSCGPARRAGVALAALITMATISIGPALAHDDADGHHRGHHVRYHRLHPVQYYSYGYVYAPYSPPVVVYPPPPPVVYVPPPQPVYVAPPPVYFPLSVGLSLHFR